MTGKVLLPAWLWVMFALALQTGLIIAAKVESIQGEVTENFKGHRHFMYGIAAL